GLQSAEDWALLSKGFGLGHRRHVDLGAPGAGVHLDIQPIPGSPELRIRECDLWIDFVSAGPERVLVVHRALEPQLLELLHDALEGIRWCELARRHVRAGDGVAARGEKHGGRDERRGLDQGRASDLRSGKRTTLRRGSLEMHATV